MRNRLRGVPRDKRESWLRRRASDRIEHDRVGIGTRRSGGLRHKRQRALAARAVDRADGIKIIVPAGERAAGGADRPAKDQAAGAAASRAVPEGAVNATSSSTSAEPSLPTTSDSLMPKLQHAVASSTVPVTGAGRPDPCRTASRGLR